MDVMLVITILLAIIGWAHSNSQAKQYRFERDQIGATYDRLAHDHDKLIGITPFTETELPPPDTRTLSEISHDEHDPVWHFAEENRDIMPRWELLNPHVAAMQSHRRYSEWATFCANLDMLGRGCLEYTIDELEREQREVRR